MPRGIRLAYFVDSMEVGGSELNAVRTLENLDRARFDLTVFHLGFRGPLFQRYAALGADMVRVSLTNLKHPTALIAGLRLIRELRRRGVEILHSHDIYSNIFSVPWARLAGTGVVIASKRWDQAVPSRVHVLANRVVSRMATRVLANSEAVARSLVMEDGVPRSRIEVIPNFVGSDAFVEYPTEQRRRALLGFGIPEGALVIGVVARLAPIKDHATLIRAVSPLCPELPKLHILFIGDGPSRPDLEALAAARGLENRVHFAGTLSNTPNPHGLLDISVLPSRSEGFPNAVVEAMAAARPVIATAVGGTPEAIVPGNTGLLVPAGDELAMEQALRELIQSPPLRRAFGAAGRARAQIEYHVDTVLRRLSDWYASLLNRS